VSRCKCEFFYAGYGESSIDPSTLDEVPPPLSDEGGPWEKRERAVDAFTLMHHDLDVCTNSLQVLNFNYYMLHDLVCHLPMLHGCGVSSKINIYSALKEISVWYITQTSVITSIVTWGLVLSHLSSVLIHTNYSYGIHFNLFLFLFFQATSLCETYK